ncbi:MAG: glycosyltransferase [Campylobacterota bacterium]|nr:glycosyltransferase [Campylobacterota bacterium]
MTFQILISTVDSHFQERALSLSAPHLIIDQVVGVPPPRPTTEHLFEYTERGLARSRNHALDHASGKICLISDDDLYYEEDIERIVTEAFEENPAADIITFQIETPDGKAFNSYKNEPFWHTKRTIMRVASVEIAFRRSAIEKNYLRFDERFGLGAEFPTGEENIFLSDALDKGLKLLYIPIPIVIHPPESSGENYNDTKLVQAKGAMFERIFGLKGYAVSLLFALKKYKFSRHTLFRFYMLMLQGAKKYRKTYIVQV